jgi:S-DNA-T family DNA segregation ATPase FtsK/SpoIIIE
VGKRVDWSFGPGHGPVSGVLNAAGAALGATMVADLVDAYASPFSPLWSLGAGTVAALAAVLTVPRRRRSDAVVAFRAASWLGAGLWSAWTLLGTQHLPVGWWSVPIPSPGTPWSVASVAALGVGTLAAGLTGLGLEAAHQREEDQQIEQARQTAEAAEGGSVTADEDSIAAVWQTRIRKITGKDVEVRGVKKWETGTGYTLWVQLPADGTTIAHVKTFEANLAAAANLPPGCNVEVLATDEGRRTILVRVATVSRLGDDHHLPDDYSADSINNDISLGIAADGSEVAVNLRYSCMVLIGQTDSGKSNELNVITRGIVRCTDAIEWAIDISGKGRYARPWVRAWHEGRAERPAIDWIAPTPDEAELMTLALIEVINGRTAAYQQRMAADGDDKILVAPDLPQIMLVVDEFKTLPQSVKDNINTISDTGRGAGVRVVSCALEAKGPVIPRGLVVQARVRMAMRVTDEAELQYLFDSMWSRGRFDPALIPWRGSGLVAEGPVAPEPMKGWRMDPKRIDAASIAVAPLRPDLDGISAELADTVSWQIRNDRGERITETMDGVYENRWDRTRDIIFPGAAGTSSRTAPATTPPPESASRPAQGVDLSAALGNLADKLAAARAVADNAASQPVADEDLPPLPADADFSVVEGWLHPETEDASGKRRPPPRQRMRQLIADSARKGTGPGPIHTILQSEGYPTSYPTVVDWLKKDLASGIVAQPQGDRTPYFPGPNMGDPYRDQQG